MNWEESWIRLFTCVGVRAKIRIRARILIQTDGFQTNGRGPGWCEIIRVSPRVIRVCRLSTAVWVDEEPGVVGVGSSAIQDATRKITTETAVDSPAFARAA